MNEVPVPYAEDPTRKAETRAEAIYGDKHGRLMGDDLTTTGEEQMAHIEAAQTQHDEELKHNLGLTAAQQVQLDEMAAHGHVDEERLDRVKAEMIAANSREQ